MRKHGKLIPSLVFIPCIFTVKCDQRFLHIIAVTWSVSIIFFDLDPCITNFNESSRTVVFPWPITTIHDLCFSDTLLDATRHWRFKLATTSWSTVLKPLVGTVGGFWWIMGQQVENMCKFLGAEFRDTQIDPRECNNWGHLQPWPTDPAAA